MRAGLSARFAAAMVPDDWRLLLALSVYRLLLVTLLLTLQQTGSAPLVFDQLDSRAFERINQGYALAGLVLLALTFTRRLPLTLLTHAHYGVDVSAILFLVYACGGVQSGLGALLLTPAVGCAVILSPRVAVAYAATGTLAVFGEELYRLWRSPFETSDFTATGTLGLMLFGTVIAANAVAQRARKSEARAVAAGSEVESLVRLNASIISHLQAGVLVVSADNQIRLLNEAARRLLRASDTALGRPLGTESWPLADRLHHWLAGRLDNDLPLALGRDEAEVIPHFTRLGSGADAPVLILLEETARLRERAQQMKLAALGRLSASIAHEIRNPLAAIANASQLLAESEELRGQNQRLLEMIRRHSGRIDKIVGDVLALSRRDAAMPEPLMLKAFLVRIAGQYQEAHPQQPRPIELVDLDARLRVRFDPSHLQQVLFNLWDNAFEHGARGGASVVVMVSGGRDDSQLWLDVADNGPGIASELHERIFEPFFSTAHQGNGLGLYLVRELCEINQARVRYREGESGACFRIVFTAPAEGGPAAVPVTAAALP
ncbi:MAG TPA: ATP-binding protein [Nevskiaceae bacterium]|nr:ATP-binding protein [Nevskiaceae bacterium]